MSKHKAFSVFENNPFIDGLLEYMDSPHGRLSDEIREVTWPLLENVDVDAVNRKLIWTDGKRLSIAESVQRIHRDHPEFPVEMIESCLVSWLEGDFVPESYSQEQLDELDRLTESWIDDHYGPRPHM